MSGFQPATPPDGRGAGWWAGMDSNHRRQNRRVYSPFPLAARAPTLKGETIAERRLPSESDGLTSEHPLHDDDIEPFAEFPANLTLSTDDFEAERTMEAD